MKRLLLSALLSIASISIAQAKIDTTIMDPYQLTEEISQKLFADIRDNQNMITVEPNYLRKIIKDDLLPYVHVNYAGSLILGQEYKNTTPADRDRFFTVLRDYFEQSYAQMLTLYKNQKITIDKGKVGDSNIAAVGVNIQQDSGNTKLNFRWRKNSKTQEWQTYDIDVEGVSMVDTKRSEWVPIIRKDGIDKLISRLESDSKKPITKSN